MKRPIALLTLLVLGVAVSAHAAEPVKLVFSVSGSRTVSFDGGALVGNRTDLYVYDQDTNEVSRLPWDGTSLGKNRRLDALELLPNGDFVFSFNGPDWKQPDGSKWTKSDLIRYSFDTDSYELFMRLPGLAANKNLCALELPNGDATHVVFAIGGGTAVLDGTKYSKSQLIEYVEGVGYNLFFNAKANGGPSTILSYAPTPDDDIVLVGTGWRGKNTKNPYWQTAPGVWEVFENIAAHIDGRSGFKLDTLDIIPSAAIPEPATMTLSLVGLGAMASLRRRQR